MSRIRRLLLRLPLIRTDEDGNVIWSWITQVAIGVGLGVAGWLLYLARWYSRAARKKRTVL